MRRLLLLAVLLLAAPAMAGGTCIEEMSNGVKYEFCPDATNTYNFLSVWTGPNGSKLTITQLCELDGECTATVDTTVGWNPQFLVDFDSPIAPYTYYCDGYTIIEETMCQCAHSMSECRACVSEWQRANAGVLASATLAGGGDIMIEVCRGRLFRNEMRNAAKCNDGIDNDGDNVRDYRQYPSGTWGDPGCASAHDDDEQDDAANPNLWECNDGRDNDDDQAIDYGQDDQCTSSTDNLELF